MTKKVLLVDDDPDMILLLKSHLSGFDCEITTAPDGLSGVTKASKVLPDVVVLDLGLPAGDGLSVLSRLRRFPTLSETSVIILTGRDEDAWRAKAMEGGADYYLTKPVSKSDFISTLRLAVTREAPQEKLPGLCCGNCNEPISIEELSRDPAILSALHSVITRNAIDDLMPVIQ